ncbi:GNAT family N-acetyltransferase [Luteococcus sp. Sow4_B9]|uniref:GNAT family N-acetyltransferase n=1 Tax=Luteococcus sp. Sow4_B9 TaxID=3438792 RepID=UPI003F9C2327
MTEFFETFNNGARHLREEQEFQKVNVAQAKRGGSGPQPLDLESGRIVLVHPGHTAPGLAVDVRRASATDHPAVARLRVRAQLDAEGLSPDHEWLDRLRDVEHDDQESQVWVAIQREAVVASLVWCPPGHSPRRLPADTVDVWMVTVDPETSGQAVLRALLDNAIARARAGGARTMVVSWLPGAVPGARLRHALGLVRDASLDWEPAPDIVQQAYRLDL